MYLIFDVKGAQMDKTKHAYKKLRILYKNLHHSYYLQSILSKILLGEDEFSNIEITTLSIICDRYLHTARKLALNLLDE